LQNTGILGELNWITCIELDPEFTGWHCTLRAGTLHTTPTPKTEPIFDTIEWPTGSIRLLVGRSNADLSAVRKYIALRVRHLEAELERSFGSTTQENTPIMNDYFLRRAVKGTHSGNT
jgi:hypothetical protein